MNIISVSSVTPLDVFLCRRGVDSALNALKKPTVLLPTHHTCCAFEWKLAS